MGKLRPGHFVEAALWLSLAVVLYVYSFEFEQKIEIYKFGATAWPRVIILLIAVAAIGQFLYHWKNGDEATSGTIGAATDDGAEEAALESGHSSPQWYLSTFILLVVPFAYMRVPEWAVRVFALGEDGLNSAKLVCAAVFIALYLFLMHRNRVGGMLVLPILFAALLEDFGFYATAPFFVIGVMYLMGERRPQWMAIVTALVMGILLFLFVSLLYVGLPTGNIHPFYDFGNWVVTLLQ